MSEFLLSFLRGTFIPINKEKLPIRSLYIPIMEAFDRATPSSMSKEILLG